MFTKRSRLHQDARELRADAVCFAAQFTKNFEPRYTAKNELNSDFIIIPAEKGRMLIWPSHVPHAVEQGTADETEDRITVPFNIMIRGRIELFTASLNLS
jgi:hypothetical protein